MSLVQRSALVERLIPVMRREFEQWPRLALTLAQASRLWREKESTCVAAFDTLVRTGFLTRREDGRFARRDQRDEERCPRCRAAAA